MPRLTVRFFIDDNEADRYDADLPSKTDARETIAACKERLKEMEPRSPEEEEEERKAWAKFGEQLKERRDGLEERKRRERELARRTLKEEG